VCIFGGVPKEAQVAALRKGVDVVIATPGRLLQLVREGQCDLECVSFAVLDEADRMLDLGFEADIREIMSLLGSERQTLMFSATWPQQVQRIAAEYVREPVHVRVGVTEELSSNRNVRQIVEVIDEWHRDRRLLELLGSYHASGKNRVLVFVLYKKEAPRLERFLQQNGWNAIAIHSDKTQEQRNHALALFRSGECPLLIATDVASRGLDVRDVTHVINYSFPLTIEDYVHRIGRTGRAGQTGTAHTLFTLASKGLAGALATVLRDAGQQVPEALSKVCCAASRRVAPRRGRSARFSLTRPPLVSSASPPQSARRTPCTASIFARTPPRTSPRPKSPSW
jgi:ATP-dependent RNA helicase DBP3